MKLQLVLLFASCLVAVRGRSANKIVGGVDVDIEDYPYQVSLQRILHICGATVLSENYIVTAAHCTRNYNASQLTIRAGTSTRNKGGVVVQVKSIHQHPQYNALSNNNDISILKLKSALSLNDKTQPIKLPKLNQDIPIGLVGVVTGWGKDKEDGEMTTHLRKLNVPVRDLEECKKIYGGVIKDQMLCAGYLEGGLDACQGDSGGPFAYNGTLIGIVSWGKGCARPNKLGIYAKVPALRDFITEITGL